MTLRDRALRRLHRLAGRLVSGTSIFERDGWDICCVLDGCRVDTFREHYPDAGAYWSVGAMSKTWLARTFADRDLSRVAYLTGNPFATTATDPAAFGYFHAEAVRETNGVETVPPAVLSAHAATVWQQRDELGVDRLVVHFMQPHVPFRARPGWFDEFAGTDTWGSRVWQRVADGEIDRAAWFDAYEDNLRWVLDEGVEPLCERVTATVALTADHGNAAGEWGVHGHPRGVAVPCVRKVPWTTVEATGEREDFEPIAIDGRGRVDREEQLRALGYV